MGRNRRRYGGYVVHAGIALTLIGIAASSSFQTNRDLRLQVGQSAQRRRLHDQLRKLTADPKNERIAFAAQLDVSRDGKHFATLNPARNYYPTQDPSAGAIGRYFMGESTSEVGLKAGARGDLWTAFQPDLSVAQPGDRARQSPARRPPPDAQGVAILALAQHYVQDPPPANFRVIVTRWWAGSGSAP